MSLTIDQLIAELQRLKEEGIGGATIARTYLVDENYYLPIQTLEFDNEANMLDLNIYR
jgi:hypothetical protein